MIHSLYIENEVKDHPITREICRRLPRAVKIPCERYGEVFNPRAQNFRLQKDRRALILARKFDHFALPSPETCGLGMAHQYYFSHMMNCIYDCRYCFLRGMYRSANLVLFVNYEDFQRAIEERIAEAAGEEIIFFSGFDCDSLAMEPVTGFARSFLDFFSRRPRAWLELRTKSTQVEALLEREAMPNVIAAFSFTPHEVGIAMEHHVPPVARRLAAMARLQERGWKLGLRFDPLIYHDEYERTYRRLFADVFAHLRAESIHSVTLGPFRLPKPVHRNMVRLYPDDPVLASPLTEQNGTVSYPGAIELAMLEFCSREIRNYIPEGKLFVAQLTGGEACHVPS